jgi:hypothetical protein
MVAGLYHVTHNAPLISAAILNGYPAERITTSLDLLFF